MAKKMKGVMYTSDIVPNKNPPKGGRKSDFFFSVTLVDDKGVFGEKNKRFGLYFPKGRINEAIDRFENNPEDSEGTEAKKVLLKPSTWFK